MNNTYYVSAYATSPSFNHWNPLLECQYFKALAEKTEIIGIEHPFFIQSEKYPLSWLAKNIPSHWSIIITALPAFMNAAKINPLLGLASSCEKDRILAVNVMKEISDYVHELNNTFGRKIVKAVHFHSLPHNDDKGIMGHKIALKQSLHEIRNINWGDTHLNIEHCDAYIPHQAADKGYLLLEDEIEALCEIGGYGIVLNWGRSAIEGHSVATPLSHIEMARKAGLLKGFFFSGCTNNPQSDYGCWKDTHMPPKDFINGCYLRNDSLLGANEIAQTLNLLNNCDSDIYMGIKVLDPSNTQRIDRKIGLNIETINAINQAKNYTTI